MKKLIVLLALFICVGCKQVFREKEVDKSKLRAYDYRLFQKTKSWEIAKAVWDDDLPEIKKLAATDTSLINYAEPTFGHTLLLFTVWHQQFEPFKQLLDLGARPNIHAKYNGTSALIEACSIRKIDSKYITELIKHGADVNDVETGERTKGNSIRNTPLQAAARANSLEIVKLLLKARANINFANDFGDNALNTALMRDNYEIVIYLLKAGADPTLPVFYRPDEKRSLYIQDVLRETLFDLNSDAHKKKMEVVRLLKENGIDYNGTAIPTYIVDEAKEKHPDNWQEYLKSY